LLEPLGGADYRAYAVREPQTTITFAGTNATQSTFANQRMTAESATASPDLQVRANWFPRWQARGGGEAVLVGRAVDGSLALTAPLPTSSVTLSYTVQPLDWFARVLAGIGLLLVTIYPLVMFRRARDSYHVASRERSAAS
jgi:hypothetical protein